MITPNVVHCKRFHSPIQVSFNVCLRAIQFGIEALHLLHLVALDDQQRDREPEQQLRPAGGRRWRLVPAEADGEQRGTTDLPDEILREASDPESGIDTVREQEPLPEGKLKEIVRQRAQALERNLILKALKEDDWNVTHTARRLGISRKGLQLKMKDYGLRQEGGDAA